jgi:hypothetical protein
MESEKYFAYPGCLPPSSPPSSPEYLKHNYIIIPPNRWVLFLLVRFYEMPPDEVAYPDDRQKMRGCYAKSNASRHSLRDANTRKIIGIFPIFTWR